MNEIPKNQYTIALDAMSGDHGPEIVVRAANKSLDKHKNLSVIFFGKKEMIGSLCSSIIGDSSRISIVDTKDIIEMSDSPVDSIRNKKDSSMRVAINLVKDGKADACVSAGNTGALMSISRFVLKTIDGVDRPAIMSAVPTLTGPTHVLDLGANVDSKPETLLQFAIMGSIAVQNTEKIDNPSVGLLNVGTQELKGNDKSQETAELLKKSSLNYIGFVEGDDIYKGKVDVIVCDGFEGNIALKASEGVAHMFSHFIKKSFTKNLYTKFVALIAKPVMNDFKSRVDPGKYNGASLLGLKGVVVKSHGNADIDLSLIHI